MAFFISDDEPALKDYKTAAYRRVYTTPKLFFVRKEIFYAECDSDYADYYRWICTAPVDEIHRLAHQAYSDKRWQAIEDIYRLRCLLHWRVTIGRTALTLLITRRKYGA